jgi:endo-1,4-beta-xylanase
MSMKWMSTVLLLAGLTAQAQTPVTLKDAFQGIFRVGAAVNQRQFSGQDARGGAIIQAQFNTISPENVLKWESVHPRADGYAFEGPDQYVAFGEKNGMFVIGHTLVWHSQTPKWVFEGVDREGLLKRMREHIMTVVGRYKGRIGGWDVVNEALNEDGTMRQSPWMKIIGDDYLAKAFEYAHEADPKAELYYNDYSLERPDKRNGAVELIKKLQASGAKVAAVGLQGHDKMDFPSIEEQEATIAAFEKLGIKVNITELDIDVLPAKVDPYKDGLPETVQQALAQRYADLFGVFLKHRGTISRITFWGVTDGDSWLNNWPVRGRTSYPLLFDRNGQRKPAFDAVVHAK